MHYKRLFSYRLLWLVIPLLLLITAQWTLQIRKRMPPPKPQQGLILHHPLSLTPLIVLPPGTHLTTLPSHPGFTHIELPATYRWIGVDQRSRSVELSSFLLACNNAHDCNRFYYQPMPDTTVRTTLIPQDTLRPKTVPSLAWQPLQDGLVVDVSQPSHWIGSPDSLRLFLPAFPVLLTDTMILKVLSHLLSMYTPLNPPPPLVSANRDSTHPNISYLPMALFGRLLFCEVPHTTLPHNISNTRLAQLSRFFCERNYTLPWSIGGLGTVRLANPALYDPWSPHLMAP